MTLSLPPNCPPAHSTTQEAREWSIDVPGSEGDQRYPELRSQLRSTIDTRDVSGPTQISLNQPVLHSQQEGSRLQYVLRDDLSDSLHSLTFDEATPPGSTAHTQITSLAEDGDPMELDDLGDIPLAGTAERHPHSQQQLSQENDGRTLTPTTRQEIPAEQGEEPTAINADPSSGAVQRSELNYGRHYSSPRSLDMCHSHHGCHGVEEEDGNAAARMQSSLRLEPLLSRLVQSRPRQGTEQQRHGTESGASTPLPRASRAPYAPRKMPTKPTLRSQAPAPHAPILRPRKPPVNHRLRTPDRRDEESVQHLQQAPSPPPAETDTDASLFQDLTPHKPPKPSRRETSDGKGTADYGSEDELLLKPDVPAEPAMATEAMSSMNGLGSRQTNGGPGRVVSRDGAAQL